MLPARSLTLPLRIPGVLSAARVTGTDKQRNGYQNGDALLIDLERRVFAVSDATERHPYASAELLDRLAASLDRVGPPASAEALLDLLNREVFAFQRFEHKCTLSCAVVQSVPDGLRLLVAQGGDSSVTVYDPQNRAMVYRTASDMNFAGRSPTLGLTAEVVIPKQLMRVILATDGLQDLQRLGPFGHSLPIDPALLAGPVDQIALEVAELFERCPPGFEHDDLGLIVLDPWALVA